MMEIGYRAWDIEEEKFCDAVTIDTDGSINVVLDGLLFAATKDTTIIEISFGVKDKNGKLYFEGDVVQTAIQRLRGVVKFIGTEFCLVRSNGVPFCMDVSFWEKSENLGNIHENPELLQEEE